MACREVMDTMLVFIVKLTDLCIEGRREKCFEMV